MSAPAPSSDPRSYWAAERESDRAAANVAERIRRYNQWQRDSGRADRMIRGFSTFYGHAPDGLGDTAHTRQSGDQGEFVDVTLNKYATLVTQSTVRTTAEKPAFRAIATNADSASLEEASFAQGLLEFYSNTLSIADRDYEMVQTGDMCAEGWQIHGWDTTKGRNLTDFTDEALHEGDVDVHSSTPFRVAYDPAAESIDRLQWFAFKRRFNRFDLAAAIKARYPEAADKLLDLAGSVEDEAELDPGDVRRLASSTTRQTSEDLVWVWEFRHLPSAALPNGRLLRFVNAECVVFDSFQYDKEADTLTDHGYPYGKDDLHAYRYSPLTVVGSIAGHAPSFDLLGLQELKDTCATQAASAANAGGITNLWTMSGDKPSVSSVVGALNFIQSKTKPEVLKGVELSAQVPAFDQMLDRNMQERMGESDVSLGNVPKGMPGNLAALLEAKTVQYNSRAQASYAHVLERSRTGMLKLLQRFAKSERIAVLGGKANGYKHETWSAARIEGVDRFVVESVSPLTQTYAGKMDAADKLLERGMIDSPQQFLLVRETGRFEPLVESAEAALMSVRKEKELLQKGIGLPPIEPAQSLQAGAPVFVEDGAEHVWPLAYDKHWLFIPEDLGVLAMPSARSDAKVVEAVLGVVEERKRLLAAMPPDMLAMLNCPEQVVMALQAGQMPFGGPPMGAKPPGGKSDEPLAPEVGGLPAGAPRIAAPKPARPPPNPLTGEQQESPVEA